MAATVFAQDINGKRISVGTEVAVRCQITSLNPVVPGVTKLGAGDTITVQVIKPGNTGDITGVSFTISPNQCQIAQESSQEDGN